MKKDTDEKKISIILPVYNDGRHISETIESLLTQDYKNYVIKILDNCSTDNTIDVVESYIKNETKIRLVQYSEHVSMSESFSRVKSQIDDEDIVKLMCGDDYLYSNCLTEINSVYQNNPNVVMTTSYEKQFGSSSKIRKIGDMPKIYTINGNEARSLLLANNNWIGGPHAVSIRSSVFAHENFDLSYKCAFDWEFWMRILNYGDLYNIPKILYGSRIHKSQGTYECIKSKNFYNEKKKILYKFAGTGSVSKISTLRSKPGALILESMRAEIQRRERIYILLRWFLRVSINIAKKTLDSFIFGKIYTFKYKYFYRAAPLKMEKKFLKVNEEQAILSHFYISTDISDLRARIWTPGGLRLLSIQETPHYRFAIDIINKRQGAGTIEYIKYVEEFFPEYEAHTVLKQKTILFNSFKYKFDIGSIMGIVYSQKIACRDAAPKKKCWIIHDGIHRIAFAHAIGTTNIQVAIAPISMRAKSALGRTWQV